MSSKGTFSLSRSEEKELLEEQEREEEYGQIPTRSRKSYFSFGPKTSLAVSFTLFISLLLNFYHAYRNNHNNTCLDNDQQGPHPVSRYSYSGLKYDQAVTYLAKTDYQATHSKNETLTDELWDSISIDSITIAVDREWAASQGLPPSDPFYWDLDKDLYHVKGIHDMHCLKYIRYYVTQSRKQNMPLAHYVVDHMGHCLDSLRQDIMCTADDTLMPSVIQGELGHNQVMQCRDWDSLARWAKEPVRDSCFHQVSDYKYVEHNLERHANCPKDSPYYEVANEYFKIHGHKNMFGVETDEE